MCPRELGPAQDEEAEEKSAESSALDTFRKAQAARKAAKTIGESSALDTFREAKAAREAAKRSSLKPAGKTYVVQPGDTLAKIAKAQYGDASRWPEIHEANKDQIPDPNLIQVGQKLRIP